MHPRETKVATQQELEQAIHTEQMAYYVLHESQPDDQVLRDTGRWRAWAQEQDERHQKGAKQ